jgi:hypothetical protein
MPASNTPNTTAICTRTRPRTPLTPIPIAAAKLDSPSATAKSSNASTAPRYRPRHGPPSLKRRH